MESELVLAVMDKVPVLLPPCVGVKVTVTEHEAPEESDAGQLLVSPKPALEEMPDNATAEPEPLVSVSDCAALD